MGTGVSSSFPPMVVISVVFAITDYFSIVTVVRELKDG